MILIFDLMDTLIRDPFFENFYFKLSDEQKKHWNQIKDHQVYKRFEEGKLLENEYKNLSFKENPKKYQLPDISKMKKIMFRQIEFLKNTKELFHFIQTNKQKYSFVTILASNYTVWYHEIFSVKKELEEWFDYVFFSCEVGIRKPDPDFFILIHETVIKKLNLEKYHEVLYFDDCKENLDSALSLSLGWRCIWISDKEKSSEIILNEIKNRTHI
ncbi:MAG: HAD hydrolase-like protein [Leptospiraceae bacterium]|nr:HAD hydrolase-like protein [Leptospiraceae bacterium]MDW7976513.1 HAD hydrolase-like protein [Leptospiraceae bacterium]